MANFNDVTVYNNYGWYGKVQWIYEMSIHNNPYCDIYVKNVQKCYYLYINTFPTLALSSPLYKEWQLKHKWMHHNYDVIDKYKKPAINCNTINMIMKIWNIDDSALYIDVKSMFGLLLTIIYSTLCARYLILWRIFPFLNIK